MAKNKWIKVMAVLALFWIIVWIIWTWLLIIFWNNKSQNTEQSLTPEQIKQLQEMIKTNSWITISTWSINTSTGTKTLTWETK